MRASTYTGITILVLTAGMSCQLHSQRSPASWLRSPAEDADEDRIPDQLEEGLAARFAPVVYHAPDEQFLPWNVPAFLRHTQLFFYDDHCTPKLRQLVDASPHANSLSAQIFGPSCGSADMIYSGGTRSRRKQRTFYLQDVPEDYRGGSASPSDWTTYYHSYKNTVSGITIQYWRFYAFNDDVFRHGADWEGIHVVLDRNLQPQCVRLLGHTAIAVVPWAEMERDGDHVIVFAERGGHASLMHGSKVGIRHETWTTGGLVNLGEKTRPFEAFLKYSGLWGSPGVLYETSGYWGPAFNETEMNTTDSFIKAWGYDMADRERILDGVRENYPTSESR